MTPWLGIGLVLAVLVTLIIALRWAKRRFSPHAEVVRKLLHVGIGLTALTFPWLFGQVWPVLVLAAITVPAMALLRRSKQLNCHLGGVIDDVKRNESWGEVYFPLGVAGLFVLSGGNPLRYTIPILLLALADAAAAVIGVFYGRTRYTTAEGHKSAEGSLAFFAAALLSACLALFFGGVEPLLALLIALILALLMMLVEAVAWQGLDNLLIPIAGFLLLNTFLDMSISQLIGRVILTVALVGFVLLWRKQANLHDNALLGAALVGYLSWVLADWRWFIAPLIVFISHIWLVNNISLTQPFGNISQRKIGGIPPAQKAGAGKPPGLRRALLPAPPYSIQAVLSVASGGLLWLALYRLLGRFELFYLFTLAFAAQLALLMLVARRHNGQPVSALSVGRDALGGWLLLFAPFILLTGFSGDTLRLALLAAVGVGAAAFAFYLLQPARPHYPGNTLRWLRQAGCAIAGSLVGLLPLYFI